jgi:ActR/RegA family two-component response regulator
MRCDFPEHKTILCIVDDGGMMGYQKALLERRGYKVLTADSARQGLPKRRRKPRPLGLGI